MNWFEELVQRVLEKKDVPLIQDDERNTAANDSASFTLKQTDALLEWAGLKKKEE